MPPALVTPSRPESPALAGPETLTHLQRLEADQPELERGLSAQDPRLGIAWPLPVGGLSARDAAHAPLTDTFDGFDP